MNEVDLKKRAEELEQTLQLQIAQLKKDSGLWLKVGAAVLAVGLVAFKLVKKPHKRKSRKHLALGEMSEANPWKTGRKRKRKASSFFPPLNNRLLLLLFSLAQSKVMEELSKRRNRANEN